MYILNSNCTDSPRELTRYIFKELFFKKGNIFQAGREVNPFLELEHIKHQNSRGQTFLGHIQKELQFKMMAVFCFIAHEKGFTFHAQPKLAHILVYLKMNSLIH